MNPLFLMPAVSVLTTYPDLAPGGVPPLDAPGAAAEETGPLSQASGTLAALEQGPDPAGAWNRNSARFGNPAQFLGTTPAHGNGSANVLTDAVIDDLVLVLTDEPTVDIEEIDAARERLLNNPDVPAFLADMDPEESMMLLGSMNPIAPVNLEVLREDFELRRLAGVALGDRGTALGSADYDAVRTIEQARSELRQHPRAFTVLPQILAGRAPGAPDLTASIVIGNPETVHRLLDLIGDQSADPTARETGLEALPRIAAEVPELRPDLRQFLSALQQTDGNMRIRGKALQVQHRLGFRDYGEATELVDGLAWTLRNDPDPELRVSAVFHLAQVAREIRTGTAYPNHYPVELAAADGEALVRHIRGDVLEPAVSEAWVSDPEIVAAIGECFHELRRTP